MDFAFMPFFFWHIGVLEVFIMLLVADYSWSSTQTISGITDDVGCRL